MRGPKALIIGWRDVVHVGQLSVSSRGRENFSLLGHMEIILGRQILKKRTGNCLRIAGIFLIYINYTGFLRVSLNRVRSDYYPSSYAQKMAHSALVTIDFLLDTMRFSPPPLITGLK